MEFQPITVNVHPDSKYNLVKLLEHHLIFYKKSGYRYHPYFEIVDGLANTKIEININQLMCLVTYVCKDYLEGFSLVKTQNTLKLYYREKGKTLVKCQDMTDIPE